MKEYDMAILDLSRAIDLAPEYAGAYGNRGNVYNTIGKKTEAIADFEKFIELSDDPMLIEQTKQLLRQIKTGG